MSRIVKTSQSSRIKNLLLILDTGLFLTREIMHNQHFFKNSDSLHYYLPTVYLFRKFWCENFLFLISTTNVVHYDDFLSECGAMFYSFSDIKGKLCNIVHHNVNGMVRLIREYLPGMHLFAPVH